MKNLIDVIMKKSTERSRSVQSTREDTGGLDSKSNYRYKPNIRAREMRSCQRVHKIWLIAGIIVIALIYILFATCYAPSLDSWRSERFNFALHTRTDNRSIRLNSTTKKILFWNTMFGDETFYFGKGDIFRNCPDEARDCWAIHERTLANVEDYDAILFHGSDLTFCDIPARRLQRQYYVFVNLESPENRPIPDSRYENDFFNRTMTYRLDSDIVWSYADIREIENGEVVAPRTDTVWNGKSIDATGVKGTAPGVMRNIRDRRNTIKTRRKKSKTAVWFVSNCKTPSGREKYVDELGMHVDVDIYGSCGKEVRCPTSRDCFREVVEPEYYFYLSFENSMCQDYVTEKLFNALKYDVVPIVYGGANYSLFAPPKSYINALDFDSPRELATYLKRLIAQPTEYDKYFEWKKTYEIVNSNNRVICQLCQYLHENNNTKSYSPLSAWYKSDKCPMQEKLRNVSYMTKKDLNKR